MMKRAFLLVAIALVSSSCAALGIGGNCEGTEVVAEFDQVGDLVENSNVQSRDVVIGSVRQIELDEWVARTTLCIDKEEKIPADAHATVRTTSLLGEKFVELASDSEDGPFLEDGDFIPNERTSKASELEDVFARLATVLGAGNLEDINVFTASQARILEGNTEELRTLLGDLRKFTGTLDAHKGDLSAALESLDNVSTTVLGRRDVLEAFLSSFGDSAKVLSDQKEELETLLRSLDRFSAISVKLIDETEENFSTQLKELRPILQTAVENSANIQETLRTLATYAEWWPESMPGDYLQLDVCQALPEKYEEGHTCPQNDQLDNPDFGGTRTGPGRSPKPRAEDDDSSAIEHILRRPLEGEN